jgi:hypothetical protein
MSQRNAALFFLDFFTLEMQALLSFHCQGLTQQLSVTSQKISVLKNYFGKNTPDAFERHSSF